MEVDNEEDIIEDCNGELEEKRREKRTSEEVKEILKLANIKSENVAPLVQTLYSPKGINPEGNFKIMELDDHLLEALNVGDSLSFRGDEKEPVVFCSSTRTYEVKEAEISNTCLLVPNLKLKNQVHIEGVEEPIVEEVEVKGIFNTYFELKESSPRLSKLLVILEPSSFKGLEYETTVDPSTFYNWDKLRDSIQASDGEILAALPEYLIACMDGYYRLISFEFEARALPLMLDLIEENSWEIDEVEKDVSYDSLKEIIPKPVFDMLFEKYTDLSTKTKEDGSKLYVYNEAKSSRLLAHILLTACPTNSFTDFMEAWKIGSPDCISPKEEYLYGIAVVTWNKLAMRREVILFPESNLPDNIHKRLTTLFKVKEKWKINEITPYISKFTSRKQDVNAILTKYARSSTVNGVKYFSAKHGK